MNKLLILPVILGLTACAGQNTEYLTNAKAAEESVKCEYDSFSKQTSCIALGVGSPEKKGLFDNSSSLSVRPVAIFPDNGGETIIGMNGGFTGYKWFNPRKVIDNSGKELKMEEQGHEIPICMGTSGCLKIEKVSILLSKDYFKKHIKDGFSLKAYGEGGQVVVDVPAPLVEGFYNFVIKKESEK